VCNHVHLVDVGDALDPTRVHGEWMGFLKVSAAGARILSELLAGVAAEPETRRRLDMAGLLRRLLAEGHSIRVLYTTGNWLDVDTAEDVRAAARFR
jgi:phosphoenolpyruvate phosphomutase